MHSIAGRSAIGAILALSTVSGMGQCRFPKEGRADAIENSILGVGYCPKVEGECPKLGLRDAPPLVGRLIDFALRRVARTLA